MARKKNLKRIEDTTKRQVTFSKRRSSLIRKSQKISVCCNADVAFITFSPSGRLSKYCNRKRIADIIQRYVDLPTESRNSHRNIKEKVDTIRALHFLKGDESKLHYLRNKLELLELQVKKYSVEVDTMEARLRDYEADAKENDSIIELLSCKTNLMKSLQLVKDRKKLLLHNSSFINGPSGVQPPSNSSIFNDITNHAKEYANAQRHDYNNPPTTLGYPWSSQYSSTDFHGQTRSVSIVNDGVLKESRNYQYNVGIPNFPSMSPSQLASIPSTSQNSFNNDGAISQPPSNTSIFSNIINYAKEYANAQHQFNNNSPTMLNYPLNSQYSSNAFVGVPKDFYKQTTSGSIVNYGVLKESSNYQYNVGVPNFPSTSPSQLASIPSTSQNSFNNNGATSQWKPPSHKSIFSDIVNYAKDYANAPHQVRNNPLIMLGHRQNTQRSSNAFVGPPTNFHKETTSVSIVNDGVLKESSNYQYNVGIPNFPLMSPSQLASIPSTSQNLFNNNGAILQAETQKDSSNNVGNSSDFSWDLDGDAFMEYLKSMDDF